MVDPIPISEAGARNIAIRQHHRSGVLSADSVGLRTLGTWFNDLFSRRSSEFTAASLLAMEAQWLAAAASRARARLLARRTAAPSTSTLAPLGSEDFDTLDDVFATVRLPIGLLNMDYAGNNIRNVGRVREVLARWPEVVGSTRPAYGKQRSELNLLGFAEGTALTPLGVAAASAASHEKVAELWCAWLQSTSDADLAAVNAKLPATKRVFTRFWNLKEDVRGYFLLHAEQPRADERPLLQVIELLCNASDVVQEFSLEDIASLVSLLAHPARLPAFVRDAVLDYKGNKGTRGWDFPDRRILPLAWRDARLLYP